MRSSLAAYSFSHFCVDFACFWLLFSRVVPGGMDAQTVALALLIYNMLAFGLQPFIGYLCDTHPGIPAGLIGCIVAAAGLLLSAAVWPALVLVALGNAFFHIGGGINSLNSSRMARSGVFVSTGALGVALGTLSGAAAHSVALPLSLLLASAALIAWSDPHSKRSAPVRFTADVSSNLPFTALALLVALSVVIRSFVGSSLTLPWKSLSPMYGLLPAVCAFAGKAAGGVLGDKMGAKNTGVVSLLLALPCLAFGSSVPLIAMAGIVLFNLTMPITLCTLASRLPGHPGLAFGITTLALLVGNVPTFFFKLPGSASAAALSVMIAVSACCILLSTRNQKGGLRHDAELSARTPAA